MKPENYLKTFTQIVEEYDFKVPLAAFLTVYYRKNPQMGSRDRKMASALLYAYFRLGKAAAEKQLAERLALALFLTQQTEHPVLAYLNPVLNEQVNLPSEQKNAIAADLGVDSFLFFPWMNELSGTINKEQFAASQLQQPDLFIRVRKQFLPVVIAKLEQNNCVFTTEDNCIRLVNAQNLQTLFEEKEQTWFEVQDRSSQQTGAYFAPLPDELWWDCCAASGGKSLLLLAEEPTVKVTVSDIRDSSLANLDARFTKVNLKYALRRKIDLTLPVTQFQHNSFDGIILDAPCSGSGTWGRSPEMISSFEETKINWFHELQFTIAKNVAQFVKPNKPLIYITCSVFEQENEAVTKRLVKELGLVIEKQEILEGYKHKSDTMYVARLTKKE